MKRSMFAMVAFLAAAVAFAGQAGDKKDPASLKEQAPAVYKAAFDTSAAERINHEGRILGPQPIVTAPMLFNTAGADAVALSQA